MTHVFIIRAIILISTWITVATVHGDQIITSTTGTGEAEECINPAGKFGICIPLIKCKVLLEILKEVPLKPSAVRFLQHSTCAFDKDDPLVCCVVSQENKNSSPAVESPTMVPSATPTVSKMDSDLPFPGTNVSEEEVARHANFKLLPQFPGCGNSLPTDRIIGGTATGLGAYPWMALLGFQDSKFGDTMFGCGGTLINSWYVLTAAHCVSKSKLPEGITLKFVRLGEYDQRTDPDCQNNLCAPKVQDIPVDERIPHEAYDQTGTNENDIAIIRLKHEANLGTFVSPVCLPTGEMLRYDLGSSNHTTVAGWGRLKGSVTDNSDVLQHVTVPVRSGKDCNDFYSKKGFRKLDQTRFCAGGERGKDSCQGDSGGPLMESVFQKRLHQARIWQFGVVSLGPSPCGSSNPALYTRVSEFIPWMLDHMKP